MNLQIDVGNTLLKWRVLSGDEVVARGVEPTVKEDCLSEFSLWYGLESISIACVASIEVRAKLMAVCHRCRPDITPFVADVQSRFNVVECGYEKPEQLGVDRWLALVAGFYRYQESCCVVDCGSAITVDIVDDGGKHQGGYILPGLGLMKNSLSSGTKRVGFEDEVVVDIDYGHSTTECVHHGLQFMLESLFEGLLQRTRRDGVRHFIVTGGDAARLAPEGEGVEISSDLVFEGLSLVTGIKRLPVINKG